MLGTVLFVLYNGYRNGSSYLARYYALKGMSKQERQDAVAKHRGALAAFGSVCVVLSMIPGASLPLQLTNQIGAALYASQIERGEANVDHAAQDIKKEL